MTTLFKRRSLRLRHYDYSQAGAYFVTVCVKNQKCLFGKIVVGAGPRARPDMVLNNIGEMVHSVWREIPNHYAGVALDSFIVMPNHVHGIVVLNSDSGHPRGGARTLGLPDVVHRFKSLTTARYRHGIKKFEWPRFDGKLWHRNYYERIIRKEKELFEMRNYVEQNPIQWHLDPENPDAQT